MPIYNAHGLVVNLVLKSDESFILCLMMEIDYPAEAAAHMCSNVQVKNAWCSPLAVNINDNSLKLYQQKESAEVKCSSQYFLTAPFLLTSEAVTQRCVKKHLWRPLQ